MENIDLFDAQFFGISPREAPYVDPQHRLLLETAWEAIEDAGIVLNFEHGTDLGVFVGISHNEYQGIQGTPFDHTGIGPHSPTGCAHSIAADFRNAPTGVLRLHQLSADPAREMSRERSRGQPGMTEIGPPPPEQSSVTGYLLLRKSFPNAARNTRQLDLISKVPILKFVHVHK